MSYTEEQRERAKINSVAASKRARLVQEFDWDKAIELAKKHLKEMYESNS